MIQSRSTSITIAFGIEFYFSELAVYRQVPIPRRPNAASLSIHCHCFHTRGSVELLSSVSIVQTFTAGTRHATYIELNQPHFPHLPNVRRKFHTGSFFPRTDIVQNRLQYGFFP